MTAANEKSATVRIASLALTLVWICIYGARAYTAHQELLTNAYDLSVFDYALWSPGHLPIGYVPFLGQSLFAQHFMPTLGILWPAYQGWPAPGLLIALQIAAFAGAAALLYRLLPADLSPVAAIAILAAFLFGRRSHSAVTSFFYVESLEPLLVLATIALVRLRRFWAAAGVALLALGCKEDVAIYFFGFGVLLFFQNQKRPGATLAIASILWFMLATVVFIPALRGAAGLPSGNPFLEAFLDSPAPIRSAVARAADVRTIGTIATVTLGVGFLCWLAPEWLAVALPGLLLATIANPHTTTIGITGHYLFPILPWLFYAAAIGARRLQDRSPTLLRALAVSLMIATAADWPAWRSLRPSSSQAAEASTVRRQLALIPSDAPTLAMPNLVPHLPHRKDIWTIGSVDAAKARPQYVALTLVGDQWPLDATLVQREIRQYQGDSAFIEICDGPAYVYRRR